MTPSLPEIPDRYEILTELGSGGMGTVYKVHDSILDKVFALKLLKLTGGTAGSELLRFQKEAKAAATLQHDNIVRIVDFGFYQQTTPYMVLEFVEGETLKRFLRRAKRMPLSEAVPIFEQIAEALEYAHRRNIVHRDLKSDNILISKESDGTTRIKLFDFGIAQILEDTEAMRLTATNAIIGTPSSMSPEQAKGENADARSDIYSFGCVMFETLTGRLPFKSDNTFELLKMQIEDEPPQVGSLQLELKDSPIEQLINRCLMKNPDDRFQSAHDVIKFLHRTPDVIEDKDGAAPKSNQRTFFKSNQRTLFVIGIMVISIAAAAFWTQSNEPNRPERTAPNNNEKSVDHPRQSISGSDNSFGLDASQNKKSEEEKLPLQVVFKDKPKEVKYATIANFQDQDILQTPPSVRQVDLEDLNLSARTFEYLARLPNVTRLRIIHSRVSKPMSQYLVNNQTLQVITTNEVTFEDFSDIATIKNLSSLEATDLSSKQLDLLRRCQKLKALYIQWTKLDQAALNAITGIKSLKILSLRHCDPVESGVLAKLSALPDLWNLSLRDSRSTVASRIPDLKGLRVTNLDLENDDLTDTQIRQLSQLHLDRLEKLTLNGNLQLTKDSLKSLKAIATLRELTIGRNSYISPQDIANFKNETNYRCKVKDEFSEVIFFDLEK